MGKGNFQTLTRLQLLDREAASRFPSPYDPGFGDIGLILFPEPKHGAYTCTPQNSFAFAQTGGEGVHFSLVTRDSQIADDSPVIVTIPEASLEDDFHGNYVVGENLYDFLCLGVHRGYFALEQLGLRNGTAVTAYSDPAWSPTTDQDKHVGYDQNQHQRDLIAFLTKGLQLEVWKDVKSKLVRLQVKYGPELEFSDECRSLRFG